MSDIDQFAQTLFEEAKRFLEKASEEESTEGTMAYLHAALNLGFAALEAHINAIADDFLVGSELNVLEKSILSELDFRLQSGEYRLTQNLKMYRLEDRIEFIHRRFSGRVLEKSSPHWTNLKEGLRLRNVLTHPKEALTISEENVSRTLLAVIWILNTLYTNVYQTPYPVGRRELGSTLTF